MILAIAALVAIAAPFALSMRMHERSARGYAASVKASEAARAGRELAIRRLIDGTPTQERRAAEDADDLAGSGEDVDGVDELAPTMTAVPGLAAWRLVDPKGVEVAIEVEDEQGKANLNSASGLLLGNLLGASTLALDIEKEAKELQLDGDAPFFTDGNPETYDGILVIGSELIVYRHIERTIVSGVERAVVTGLERGAFFSTPDPRMLVHRKGDLVQDARGWKLAEQPYWVEMGGYRPYVRVSGMREIASWQLVDLTLANLFRRGVTAEMLSSYGLGGEVLRGLGAGRTLDRAARPAPEKPEAPKKDAAARPEATTSSAQGDGDDDGAPAKAAPPDPEAEAEKLSKRLEKSQGDTGAEGQAAVDDALRRMGRKDGTAWLSKVLGAVGGSGSPQSKAFVDQARARMKQIEDHERTYYRSQSEQALRLADSRDLETISARELERVRPYVCAASARPGEWAGGALVVNSVDFDPNAGATTLVLGVEIPEGASGLPCRIDTPDRGPVYRRIAAYQRGNARRGPRITVFPQIEGFYEQGTLRVFVAPAHPVNINTASRRLLEALLTGLRSNPGQMTQVAGATVDFVTPAEARAVAARIVDGTVEDAQALVSVLDAAASASEISGPDRLAILLNAVDFGSPLLLSRTLPFCFRGGEVASIASTGIVNDPAGNEVARKTYREVVSVAPPRGSIVHMDSQADFFAGFTDDWLRAGQSLRPGRRANLVESFPVSLRPTVLARGPLFWPSRSHAQGQGELRLASGEVSGDMAWAGDVAVRHFRDDPEGREIRAGAAIAESSAPVVVNMQPFGAVMGPGHCELWIKPSWSDGYRVFFDTGPDTDDRNRVACWYDPDTREVVLEASDTAFDLEEPRYIGRGPRRAEIRAAARFEPNRWYHIAGCWRGTRQGDLALFIDGRAVGRESHWTRLAADIDATATRLVVEDGSIFPVRGVVRVGSELIDYDNAGGTWRDGPLGGTTLTLLQTPQVDSTGAPIVDPSTGQPIMQRQSRTGRKAHRRGTPVQIGGYTDPLGMRPGDPRSGIGPIQGRIPGGALATSEVLPSPTPKARVYPRDDQRLISGEIGILAGDMIIPVVGANEPFPLQNGVIQIGTERILYSSVVLVGGQADQFIVAPNGRGYDGTMAADHLALEHVLLCDLRVAPGNQAFDANNPFVQLSVPGGGDPQPEWLAVRKPVNPPATDKFYLDHGDTGGGVHVPAGVPWPTKQQYRGTTAFTNWLPNEVSAARGQHGTTVGSSRVDLQACKLEYSIVSPK